MNNTEATNFFSRRQKMTTKSGFLIGSPKKTKIIVQEEIELILANTSDDVIIIDDTGVYEEFCKSHKGEHIKMSPDEGIIINPLETKNYDMFEYESDYYDSYSFIISMLETMKSLTPFESSLITKSFESIYKIDPNPTFKDLLDEFKKYDNEEELLRILKDSLERNSEATCELRDKILKKYSYNEIKELISVLEYISSIMCKKSNINISNRLIILDISNFDEKFKKSAGLVALEYTWKKMCENVNERKYTWLYINELNNLVFNDYFFYTYRRCRPRGGIMTIVTGNIEEISENDNTKVLMSCSEYVHFADSLDFEEIKTKIGFHDRDRENILVGS